MNREEAPGKSPEDMYIQQKVRVLLMLKKMGSNLTPSEEAFLRNYAGVVHSQMSQLPQHNIDQGWGWGRVAFWVFILSADPTQIVTSNAVAAPTNKSGRFTAALESSYGCFSACSVRRESSVAAWCLQLQTNSLWVNFTAFLS
uniref:Beta-catenin-interacting protein 1 n=1 Tax=Lates calcarifer TaxID=8187 RepID=A0A4W6C8S1_LATCA